MQHVLVTGAGGFVGTRLVRRLLSDAAFAQAQLTFVDRDLPDIPDARVHSLCGDIADPELRREALARRPSLIYHLAGVLGGAAEADYAASRRVNVDATLSLFEEVRSTEAPPRLVFASSIAVFGQPMPSHIDDNTIPRPQMIYGAQKLMMEIALEQFTRRGWCDGLAVRLPGIVARADADSRQKAAFLNLIFHAIAEGRDFTLPVPPNGTTWLLSVPACIEALIHAGLITSPPPDMPRAITLPAQHVRIDDLVGALRRRYPDSNSRIEFAPDLSLTAQFAEQPPFTTETGERLGFKHDGDLDTLVSNAMRDD